jgi:hypothetical protein
MQDVARAESKTNIRFPNQILLQFVSNALCAALEVAALKLEAE